MEYEKTVTIAKTPSQLLAAAGAQGQKREVAGATHPTQLGDLGETNGRNRIVQSSLPNDFPSGDFMQSRPPCSFSLIPCPVRNDQGPSSRPLQRASDDDDDDEYAKAFPSSKDGGGIIEAGYFPYP